LRVDQFEEVCRKSGFRPLKKMPTRHGYILLAERRKRDPGYSLEFWQTLWAIERDECDIGQTINNDIYAVKDGIWRQVTLDDRLKDVMTAADQWIRDNVKVSRYG